MQRRTLAVLIGLLVVGTAAMATYFVRQGPPTVPLSEEADTADEVTLYQNGLAAVELHRTFEASDGPVLLEIPVPSTTITDSLRLSGDGVAIKEIRAAPSLSGPMQPGDELVVHVEDRTYRGTLVTHDGGNLVLSQDGNTTIVSADRIEAIEVAGQDLRDTDPDATTVRVLAEAEGGNHTVTVTYLARGPGWHPSYHLDLDTGETTFFATLTGLHTWRNVTLDLVAGEPRVVAQPSPGPQFERSAGFDDAADGAGSSFDVDVGTSVPVGELHRYPLERPINLTQGETVRLPVRTGELGIERSYHQVEGSTGFGGERGASRSLDVLERYELENTFDEPLPPGVMRFYRGQTWVGEDVLDATPAGETSNVTAARSLDVTAELVLERLESETDRETYTYRLSVHNRKATDTEIDLQAILSYPSHRTNLQETDPEPTRVSGTTVTWDATVEVGEDAAFRLTYEQLFR